MANAIYRKFLEYLLDAVVNGTGGDLAAMDVRAILIDSADYTFSQSHDFLDDVPAGARVAVTGTLAVASVTNGTLDVADGVWTAVTGDQSEAVLFYDHNGGADSARRLMCFFDSSITGAPVTPSGGNINLIINASGVFALG